MERAFCAEINDDEDDDDCVASAESEGPSSTLELGTVGGFVCKSCC